MHKDAKHYENERRKHRLVFATAVTIGILSFLGIILFVTQVRGESAIFSLTIAGPNTVTSQPAQEVEPPPNAPGASAPFNFLDALRPVFDTESDEPAESIAIRVTEPDGTTPPGGTFSSTEVQIDVPVLSSSEVQFSGVVSTPDSIVFIELHPVNGTIFTSTLTTDAAGFWSWQPSRELAEGQYVLYVYAFDPTGRVRLAETSFAFEIAGTRTDSSSDSVVAQPQTQPRTSIEIPPALLEQRQVLFDIRAEILGESHPAVIQPGDDLLTQISLLNIGSPGFIVDTLVNYKLVGPAGNTVFEEEETVAVSTQTSYLKRFSTGPGLDEGNYRFIASVRYEDTQAVSFDEFRISGPSVVKLPGAGAVNVTLILQILVGIFGLAVLVTYLEYRNIQLLGKIIHQVTSKDLDKEGFFVK